MALAHRYPEQQPLTSGYMSEADYLVAEQHAEEKHEYVDGKLYAMADASKRHNRIAMNFVMHLSMAARQSSCAVYASDVKVRSLKHKSYYYPDVVVSCGDDNADPYYLEKPCLIVEVVSASTARKDYLEKTVAYQAIPSLQAYLLVAQDEAAVDVLLRDTDGWVLQRYEGVETNLTLPCLNLELTLAMLYEGVTFCNESA